MRLLHFVWAGLSLLVFSLSVSSQNCIDLAGTNPFTHTQNFNALGASPAPQNGDANNVFVLNAAAPRRYLGKFDNAVADNAGIVNMPGWALVEEGTSNSSVTGRYNTSDGSQAGGNTFSYGTDGDRALGSLNDDGVPLTFVGGCFRNAGNSTLTSVVIAFAGEMWRRGAAGTQTDRLDFQYAINATNLYAGSYSDYDPFDFVTPDASGAAGPRDGNQAAYRTIYNAAVLSVALPPNGRLYVRWRDSNIAGPDDGLAIDDFYISFFPTSAAPVEIGGRVTDDRGRGLFRATVTMTAANGETRTVRTNSFGYYRFGEVSAGESYVLGVTARGRSFENPTLFVSPDASVDAANFRASPR